MERNYLGEDTHGSAVNVAVRVRIGLLTALVIAGSIALALTFLNPHQNARASTAIETATTTNPWGLVQDGTHVWVAEPGCDLAPKCQTAFQSVIGEYSLATPGSGEKDFTEPSGYSSPGFLVLDGSGNIWFTEPTTDAIGELTPTGTGTWHQFSVTAGSVPRDLVFDSHGNIWFTEAGSNSIGFFNTISHAVVDNALSTAGSDPYGIAYNATTSTVWFAENGNTKLGNFTPTTTGTISITETSIGTAHAHMLALDSAGNVWYSEGAGDAVGEYNTTTRAFRDLSVASAICPTGSPPTCLNNTFVAGVGVDSNGMVWFDEQQTGSVGFIDPTSTPTVTVSTTISSPFDGLIVDGSNNVWVTEKFTRKLAEIPGSSLPTPTPSPSPSPNPGNAPVSKTWYFAEGKVGAGFTEFLTIENPDTVNNCAVDIQYLLGSGNPVTKSETVSKASRFTESVNSDLNTNASGTSFQTDSAVVTVNNNTTPNCAGVVAERPMYFSNFSGVSSGSDVLGATSTGTTFYFADVPTGGGYSSYITILNPGNSTATVTANFISHGSQVGTPRTVQVSAGRRGTIIPNNNTSLQHAAVTVTSDQPVVVERPVYFSNVNGGNAHSVSGAASVVGVPLPKNDWLFAEGYTGSGFQEYLVLANFGSTSVSTNVILEFSNGHTETVPYTISAMSQTFVDVNADIAAHRGTCDTTPCRPTLDVSTEVSSTGNFIAEREMFFHYNTGKLAALGGSDVIGQAGPASATAYSFAEGYTNTSYNEWLTLQNPTTHPETISVTLVNGDGHSTTQSYTMGAHSRYTVDITGLVAQKLIAPHDTYLGYEVSMVVQSSSGAFVAERPMYWNTGSRGTQGGSDVIGYI